MELHVLPRRPPDPEVFTEPLGRFGDWREPFEINLPRNVAAFADELSARRLPFQVAVALVVEAALLLESANQLRIPGRARLLLDEAARPDLLPSLGPGKSNRSYIRLLEAGSPSAELSASECVMLPVRLHERAHDLDPARVFACQLLSSATRWEQAAVGCGRLMEEWGLLVLAATLVERIA